jgi:hypothetical protein
VQGDGLKMTGRWEKLGELPLAQLHCVNGWLALGWNNPAASPKTAAR